MSVDMNQIKAELEEIRKSSGAGFTNRYILQPGRNDLRLINPVDDIPWYIKKPFHMKITDLSFPCPAIWGKECVCCKTAVALDEAGNKRVAYKFKQNFYYFVRVIDMAGPGSEVQIARFPKTCFGQILVTLEIPGYETCLDPSIGRSLIIDVQQSSGRHTYTVTPNPQSGPIHNMDLLKDLPDLESSINPQEDDRIADAVSRYLDTFKATPVPASIPAPALSPAAPPPSTPSPVPPPISPSEGSTAGATGAPKGALSDDVKKRLDAFINKSKASAGKVGGGGL